ncbi:MAG: metal-dependent hydrolase [Arenicellales bacterium]|nr:metal-dependent hydrolase [Arenicellales bacterium]MDP7490768.1 metal-dependent hydrolase [Arenicellales bacterium]MDP7562972.1 metal-dependent hydrolase [Arenicellales bacterium]
MLAFMVTGLARPANRCSRWWLLLVVLAGCAADLDFLPGLLFNDPNRFHHGPSHSLLAAVLFGAGVSALGQALPLPRGSGRLAALIYASHLLGDWLAADDGAPFGIPLLWPFSMEYFISPVTVFSNFHHGTAGAGLTAVLANIFSMHNLAAVALEVALLLPLLVLVQWWRAFVNPSDRRGR